MRGRLAGHNKSRAAFSLDQFLDRALRDDHLRSTSVEVIDALKDACFDAKRLDKPFIELPQARWGRESFDRDLKSTNTSGAVGSEQLRQLAIVQSAG
jgi:hypothetical protein